MLLLLLNVKGKMTMTMAVVVVEEEEEVMVASLATCGAQRIHVVNPLTQSVTKRFVVVLQTDRPCGIRSLQKQTQSPLAPC